MFKKINLGDIILLAFFIILLIFMSIMSPIFFTFNNIIAITEQMSELGIIALGMTVIVLSSGLDLSIGSITGLSAVVIGFCFSSGINIGLSMILGLSVAVLCGAINGFFIAKIGVSSILVTLGTMVLFNGIALAISRGNAISGFPQSYYFIGQGHLGFIPIQTLIFIILATITSIILKKTPLGRKIYFVGSNPVVAKYSGINITKVLMFVYMYAALLCGISCIVITSRVATARADIGAVYLLQSIAAVVLGGTSINGGEGSIMGTIIGVCIFGVLANGFNLIGVSPFIQTFMMGFILIFVLLTNSISSSIGITTSNKKNLKKLL
ncbi:ABC transporter permease [Clostridium grantii]|uniref:Ribose transport system permease protein n=1 Tax=Clostridium grantii DSM 8605 TaxID=1121316 RepID=A0A1M5SVV9_9CLOT|nr:ABC transporter permease [Clostridium grantii]SHH42701.1 ribose transport system permease protein [Clostridium grantii DSM 8605]